jgi:hypothetical protein
MTGAFEGGAENKGRLASQAALVVVGFLDAPLPAD